ncbi:MAG: thiolase family protein [Deltaproteobacteria bacterium]|nr:thiolase family protein [Deltaproteobacteria bacterium]MBW2342945.1 thiolase family protein [Deltaproteobacteria bacterium]
MGERVAIVGMGQTHHRSRIPECNGQELIAVAVRRALRNADLTMKDIDAVVIGNMDHFESINYVDMWGVLGFGGYMKPVLKVTTGGTTGSSTGHAAFYHVASGLFEVVLAIGWEQNSESDTTAAIVTHCEPFIERDFYGGAIGGLAAQYSSYMDTYGATEEDAALVSVRDRNNAAMYNPYAHLRQEITFEEVMHSPYISYPIRFMHMCPRSDGACAVIFAESKKAKKICRKPAWVLGVGSSHNFTYLGDPMGVPGLKSLEIASTGAYKMAGVDDPLKQIDVAEMYLPAATAGVSWMEAMRFCPSGGGPDFVRSGVSNMDGDLPINPSGGVLSTNCIGATGLIRIGEAALQVMGEAEKRQIPDVKVAVATGFGGCFWSDVTILGTEPYLD